MNDRLLVGNDIVDLRDRRCPGKSRHLRFVNRVFHPAEASRILSSPDADGMLWLHWAAKESAYKVASKVLGDPPRVRVNEFERTCMDCHRVFLSSQNQPGLLQHEHIQVDHGLHRDCWGCHDKEDRDRLVGPP